jgi:hypothetical protein
MASLGRVRAATIILWFVSSPATVRAVPEAAFFLREQGARGRKK